MEIDALCRQLTTSDRVVVPENAALIGGTKQDFLQMGCLMLRELLRTTALGPASHVLEIGCGLGRIAYPLALFLDGGRYVGLDVVRDSVRFCEEHVRPLAAEGTGFEFIHLDFYNEFYNPGTPARLDSGVLPALGDFDLVFMSSVCTHLEDADLRAYLAQAARWTRPGGEFWATFFLIDDAAELRLAEARRQCAQPFDLSGGGPDYYFDGKRSTVAVAYRPEYVAGLLAQSGFTVKSIEFGSWSGAKRAYYGFQDLLVATRT